MRPLSRLRPAIEAVLSTSPQSHQLPYVCRSCRTFLPRRHASILSWVGGKKTEDQKSETSTAVGHRIEQNEEDFVPASTWEGLEWIGTREWERKRNAIQGHKFERYGGNKRVTDPKEIRLCVKKALVAVVEARNQELGKFQEATREQPTIKNIKHLEGSWASGWKVGEQGVHWKMDISDNEFRFAVVKRLALVSGIHLTDPAIMRISNTYDLLNEAAVLPKQKKLIVRQGEKLVVASQKKTANGELDLSLLNLPNVKISSKRIKKEDREKEIGRWKVTDEELRARRLL
ncbi:putative ribosomal protein l50 mitochondria protein [Venturia nashicola]|uniref:Large ribosomal subunit protein mL50 n=1 Tax=Venturia nashicola TaxID=86259 RepID=A0A4Z1PCI7_9PEZI|nr:putative ribosomal protein l50 mitochondria protein [Venturia nashicola]